MRQRSDYPTFSDDELKRRHQAFYGLMEQEGVDAVLIYGSGRYASDIYWLSDWPSSREAYLLMQTGKEPVILMQLFNHYPMARVMSAIKDVRWAGANTTNSVVDLIRERGLESKKIGLVGSISYQVYNRLREKYPAASVRRSRRQTAHDAHGQKRRRDRAHSPRLQAHRPIDPSVGRRASTRHARRRDSGDHRAGLSKGRRLRGHSLHQQHAHARSGLPRAVAISFQSEIAKRRRADQRNQRRLLRLQRADSPDVLHRRRADAGVAENARRRDGRFRSLGQGDQRRRDDDAKPKRPRRSSTGAATAPTTMWCTASINIRRSSKPKRASATSPAK